jgi:hypothetical protein
MSSDRTGTTLHGADLIGFQRQADAANFLCACRKLALNTERAVEDTPSPPNRTTPVIHRRSAASGASWSAYFPSRSTSPDSTIWPAATMFGHAPRIRSQL